MQSCNCNVTVHIIRAWATPSSFSYTRFGVSEWGWCSLLLPPACDSPWLLVLPGACRGSGSSLGGWSLSSPPVISLATLAVLEHSCRSSLYLFLPHHCVFYCCLEGHSELHKVDGGLLLAPNDQVWSAVYGCKGGRETVGMGGEVSLSLSP